MNDFVTISNEDSVIYEVACKLRKQIDKGKSTYGMTMDRTDMTKEQWIDHAIEEAIDLAIYLTKIKRYEKMQ